MADLSTIYDAFGELDAAI